MTASRKRKRRDLNADKEFENLLRDAFDSFRLQDDAEEGDAVANVGMFEEENPKISLEKVKSLFPSLSITWDDAVLVVASVGELQTGKFVFSTVKLFAETLQVKAHLKRFNTVLVAY